MKRRGLLWEIRLKGRSGIARALWAEKGKLSFRAVTDSETVSGKFAVIEQCHEFTLVPWRPVIDR